MDADVTVEQELDAIPSSGDVSVKQRAESAMLAQWTIDVDSFDALTNEDLIEAAIVSGNALAAALAHRLTLALDNIHER